MTPLRFALAAVLWAGCAAAPPADRAGIDYELVAPLAAADSARDAATVAAIRDLPADRFAAGRFMADSITLPYRLLSPPRPEAGRRYPLVVVFHGAGEIGTDNLAHLDAFPKTWARDEIRERFPAYVLAPQMPERSALYSGPAGTPGRHSRPGPPLYTALSLIDSLRAALPIDDRRIYAVGFSMGSSTTWNALRLRPDLFAAAVPIAGVPNPAYAETVARTPVWVVHGNADTANPIGPDREMVDLLARQPGAEVRFWEVDGLYHAVPTRLLAGDELMTWLFAHER